MKSSKADEHIINHVAIVLDRSGSMGGRERDIVAVTDGLVKWLDKRSLDDKHETRVSIYLFDNVTECPVFDRDVRRLPSIDGLYVIRGGTALIDAGIKVISDLQQTAQMYGDHAFLAFFLTDGEEIHSTQPADRLRRIIDGLGDNWTVAALVPNTRGKIDAERFGFPKGNIDIWDTSSYDGVTEVGQTITTGLDNYMNLRSSGGSGTKTLFAAQVTQAAVDASGMKPLDPGQFFIIPVANDGSMNVIMSGKKTKAKPDGTPCLIISEFVRATGRAYEVGKVFYRLDKSEKIDADKLVAVVHTKTKKVYVGREARQLIKLPDTATRIRPLPKDKHTGEQEFVIYVQSTSINRHLPVGSSVLVLK